MFLEHWANNRIQDMILPQSDGDSPSPATERIRHYQLVRLKEILQYAYEKSSSYKDKLDASKVKPHDLRSLEDLQNFPFTESEDLGNNPYGFLCVPASQVDRIYSLNTGGTTGKPKRVFFACSDLERITNYMGAAMKSVALFSGCPEDQFRVAVILPNGDDTSQASLLSRGIQKFGGEAVKIPTEAAYKEQLERISFSKPDIVFGSVFRIWRMTWEKLKTGTLDEIGVKTLFLTSEYLPGSMRKRLEEVWGAEVYCHYGMTEMGFGGLIECRSHHGYHLNPVDFLFEIIEPNSKRVLEPGQEGELVFTTLTRDAMPLLRYRTGDLTRMIPEPCPCGAQFLGRIAQVEKRIATTLKLGSQRLYSSLLSDALFDLPELIDYEARLITEGSRHKLIIYVELTADPEKIRRSVEDRLARVPAVKSGLEEGVLREIEVAISRPGSLKSQGRVKKTILDLRVERTGGKINIRDSV